MWNRTLAIPNLKFILRIGIVTLRWNLGNWNNLAKFDFFFQKKVNNTELDELFLKVWVLAPKPACGRCGAYAKVEKHVKSTLNVQVTWLNLYHKTDMIWIAYTYTKRDMVRIYGLMPCQIFNLYNFFRKKSNLPKVFQSPKFEIWFI